MNKQIMVGMVLVALCSASALAGCGTCGGGEDKVVCGAGGCDVKADASAKDGTACCGKDLKACTKAVKGGVVDTAGVAALLKSKSPVVVLDARSGKYDDGKRLPGAKSLSAEASEADVATALPEKNALVVTYCAGLKCPASNKLAEKLKKLGYVNVLEYAEGMEGWLKAGNAVEKAK